MNGIIGFTELVLTTDMKKTQREYLRNVSKSAYNLLNIINDILDFSKIEAGKLVIDNTTFRLSEVLEETGVRVRAGSARYLASQPWPFPGSLMLGFIAEAEADEPVAGDELEQARWFSADEVRVGLDNDWANADAQGEGIVLSSPTSIARHVIRAWLADHDARARAAT